MLYRFNGTDMLTAADWYYHHLQRKVPVIIVSDTLAKLFGEDESQNQQVGYLSLFRCYECLVHQCGVLGSRCPPVALAECSAKQAAGTISSQLMAPASGAVSDAERLAAEGDALLDILLRDCGVGQPIPGPPSAPTADGLAAEAEVKPAILSLQPPNAMLLALNSSFRSGPRLPAWSGQ